jgi:hypothetical protein
VKSDPSVLYESGRYRMWFTVPDEDTNKLVVTAAESLNGINWSVLADGDGKPVKVLEPTSGSWDVRGPGGHYFMYYTGDHPEHEHHWSIGLATSADGIVWQKYSDEPVFAAQEEWEGPFTEETGQIVGGVQEPTVLYDTKSRLFRMWYSALGKEREKRAFRIGYALSKDGILWKRSRRPVLNVTSSPRWDDAVLSHVNVVKDRKSGYHMFYFGTSGANFSCSETSGAAGVSGAIGYAFSKDGVRWRRDRAPLIGTDYNDSWFAGGPAALYVRNSLQLFYFAAAEPTSYEASFYRVRLKVRR